tara:strand:+ start:1670 stop:2047 length:378 start_codon:yes stop_codon:yes gene_type:complete
MPKALLTLCVGEYNGTPGFSINDLTIPPNSLTEGIHSIEFDYEYGSDVVFCMFDKGPDDTLSKNNEVIKDKSIDIQSLTLMFIKIENWQFHKHIWNPYFSVNKQTRVLQIPTKDDFPLWYLQVTE